MIQHTVTTLQETYRSTSWKAVAGDLFGTTVTLTAAFMLTSYLSLWEVGGGTWAVSDLGFTDGRILTVLFGITGAFLAAPVFYGLWRIADRRLANRRNRHVGLQALAVEATVGLVFPAIILVVISLMGHAEPAVSDNTTAKIAGIFVKYFGMCLGLTVLPTAFTGVYHRLSLGDWTLRTRKFHATVAVVLVVLAVAVGASAMLAPAVPAEDTTLDYDTADQQNVSAYSDGYDGPRFMPAFDNNQTYGDYASGDEYACGGFSVVEDSPTEYDPAVVHATLDAFEVAPGQVTTENGTTTLSTRFSVRLSNSTLGNATTLDTGVYNVRYTDAPNGAIGVSSSYDSPGGVYGGYVGAAVTAENVESTHVYVDVVRNGVIHRYVTTLCPQEAANGA